MSVNNVQGYQAIFHAMTDKETRIYSEKSPSEKTAYLEEMREKYFPKNQSQETGLTVERSEEPAEVKKAPQSATVVIGGQQFTRKVDENDQLFYEDKDGNKVDPKMTYAVFYLDKANGDFTQAKREMEQRIKGDPMLQNDKERLQAFKEAFDYVSGLEKDHVTVDKGRDNSSIAMNDHEISADAIKNFGRNLINTQLSRDDAVHEQNQKLIDQYKEKDKKMGKILQENEDRRMKMVHTYTAVPGEEIDKEALKAQGYTRVVKLSHGDLKALQDIDANHPVEIEGETIKLLNPDGTVNQDNLKTWALYNAGFDSKLNTKSAAIGKRKARGGNSEVRQAADAIGQSKTRTKRLTRRTGFAVENHVAEALGITGGTAAAGGLTALYTGDAGFKAVSLVDYISAEPGLLVDLFAGAGITVPYAALAAVPAAIALGTILGVKAAQGQLNVIHQDLAQSIHNPEMMREGARGRSDKKLVDTCVDLVNQMKKLYPESMIVEAIRLAKAERSSDNVNANELLAAFNALAAAYPNGYKGDIDDAEDTCNFKVQHPIIDKCVDNDCVPEYEIVEDAPTSINVPTITYGGPYHYAQLYMNGDKPLTNAQIKELSKILEKEMHEVENDRKHRVIPNQVTLSDGTVVTLLPEDKIPAKVREIEKTTRDGGQDVRYTYQENADGTYSIIKTDCNGNKSTVRTGLSKEEAEDEANKLRNQ